MVPVSLFADIDNLLVKDIYYLCGLSLYFMEKRFHYTIPDIVLYIILNMKKIPRNISA